MAAEKRLLKNIGLAFNKTDNLEMGTFKKSWELSMDIQKETIPYSDRIAQKIIPISSSYALAGTLRQPSAAWFARMTGGSVANTLFRQVTETITKAGATVTLTSGAGANQAVVAVAKVYDTVAKTFREKVAATPVAGESYTLSTNVLTLHASDTGTTFEVTYIYSDTSASTGSKVIVPVSSFPSEFRCLLSYGMQPAEGGAIDKFVIVDAAQVLPTGQIKIGGGDAQSLAEFTLNADVMNDASGNLVFYWDSLNPAW